MTPTELTTALRNEGTKLVGITHTADGFQVNFYLNTYLWQSRPVASLSEALEARLRLLEAACDNLKGRSGGRLRTAARAAHDDAMALVARYRAEGHGLAPNRPHDDSDNVTLTTQFIKAL